MNTSCSLPSSSSLHTHDLQLQGKTRVQRLTFIFKENRKMRLYLLCSVDFLLSMVPESLCKKKGKISLHLIVILLTFTTKGKAHKTSGNLHHKNLDCPNKSFCLWLSFYIHVWSQAYLRILKIRKQAKYLFYTAFKLIWFSSKKVFKSENFQQNSFFNVSLNKRFWNMLACIGNFG